MSSTVYTEKRICFGRKAALQYLTLVNKHCGNFDQERLWFFHSHVTSIILLCHCFTNTTPRMILQDNQPRKHILSEMKERQHGSVNTQACKWSACFMFNGYFWGPRSAALAVSRGLCMLEDLEAKLLSPRIATCVWGLGQEDCTKLKGNFPPFLETSLPHLHLGMGKLRGPGWDPRGVCQELHRPAVGMHQ